MQTFAVTGPEIMAVGTRGEKRDVRPVQISALRPDKPGQDRPVCNIEPQVIKKTFSSESIPQQIGVIAFIKQKRISACIPCNTTNLIARKTRQPCLQECLPVNHEQRIDGVETVHDSLDVIKRLDLLTIETWTIVAFVQLDPFAFQAHLICTEIFPAGYRLRAELP